MAKTNTFDNFTGTPDVVPVHITHSVSKKNAEVAFGMSYLKQNFLSGAYAEYVTKIRFGRADNCPGRLLQIR